MNASRREPLYRALGYLLNVLLALLMALNYEIFIFQNAFAPAGINGLATMVQYLFHFSVGYMSLLINVPLSAAAFFLLDRDYALKTLSFSVAFSLGLLLLDRVDLSAFVYQTANGTSTILAPLAAGAVNGFIYGSVIRLNGSTGGTDVVAALVRRRRPDISLMWLIFALNSAVAALSYFVYDFRIEPVILCIAYSFVTSRISERILRGSREAVKFEIITDHPEEISRAVIRELYHSATLLHAEGMYSHQGKDLLLCVVNKHQLVDFERIIRRYPGTFAYISSVTQTMGNFKHISRSGSSSSGWTMLSPKSADQSGPEAPDR